MEKLAFSLVRYYGSTPDTSISPTTTTGSTATNTNPSNSNNLFVSILLALVGIVCLALFWKYRFSIYPLFGIETTKPIHRKVKAVNKPSKPNKSMGDKGATQGITQASKGNETEHEKNEEMR